jgi:hypothetical protein
VCVGGTASNELAVVVVDEAGDGGPWRGVVTGEHLGWDDGVCGVGEVDAVPADEARAALHSCISADMHALKWL